MATAGERLNHEDPNYLRLEKKHSEYDKLLKDLQAKRFLTSDEKLEEVRLKKMKLSLKDQMESLLQAGSRP